MRDCKGTSAALPSELYARPAWVSPDGLSVRVVGEAGEDFGTYDFSSIDAPPNLVRELALGFAKATGQAGRWRAHSTVKAGADCLQRFIGEISRSNPHLRTAAQLSPRVWKEWRDKKLQRVRWPGSINVIRTLLKDVDSLPQPTRQALLAPIPKPKTRLYHAYSKSEFERIRSAARRTVRAAEQRISSNLKILHEWRVSQSAASGSESKGREDGVIEGAFLDYLSKTGNANGFETSDTRLLIRKILEVKEDEYLNNCLFLSNQEVAALFILFVCERGYNISVLDSIHVGEHRADDHLSDPTVHAVEMDKPRRGPNARYFSNNFVGSTPEGALWEKAVKLTQPARDTLANQGQPTNQLFIARSAKTTSPYPSFFLDWTEHFTRQGVQRWTKKSKVVGDDGLPLNVTFRRLRLTEQVINQRARQNSEVVSETIYQNPDPQTHEAAAKTILQGQADALAHAEVTTKMKALTPSQIAKGRENPEALASLLGIKEGTVRLLLVGQLDTATGACMNFHLSPFAEDGTPCPASFLMCFGCKNAVATPDHLPRLVALYDALIIISSAVTETVWLSDYAEHFSRLGDLLSQMATQTELELVRRSITDDDIKMLGKLLERRLDQ